MKTVYEAKHAPFKANRIDMMNANLVCSVIALAAAAVGGTFGYLLHLAG